MIHGSPMAMAITITVASLGCLTLPEQTVGPSLPVDATRDGAPRPDGLIGPPVPRSLDAAPRSDSASDGAARVDAQTSDALARPVGTADASSCVPVEEICNGLDDDCDDRVDERGGRGAEQGDVCECHRELEFIICMIPARWRAARRVCRALGAELVILENEGDSAAMHAVLARFSEPPDMWWIGLSDILSEGEFRWENGALVDYADWADGEPNNEDNEDCVELRRKRDRGSERDGWNDNQCSELRRFVCGLP